MNKPIIGWGLGMCTIGLINTAIFGNEGPQAPALLFGIGGFMVALGLFLTVTGLRHNRAAPVLSLPDVSPPTTFTAFGFVLMALGSAFGLWLVWIGGGVVLIGLGGVIREGRAQRRALRRAFEEEAK